MLYGLKGRLLIVKIRGHIKLFDLYKPVLIYMTKVTMFLIVIIDIKGYLNSINLCKREGKEG